MYGTPQIKLPTKSSLYIYISFYYCYFILFFGFVGRSWSFLGLVPTQVSSIFFLSSRGFFVGVFLGL